MKSVSRAIAKRQLQTSAAPTPAGCYSQGLIAGGFIFISGQRPVDPASGRVPNGIRAQTDQVLQNVAAILSASGGRLSDVVKVTAHLSDLANFAEFDDSYSRHFTQPYPVRTTVGSALRGILVEVDVIAIEPQTRAQMASE
jgi:reactive intermediate/imine deaminase